jgi:hypothetical protein
MYIDKLPQPKHSPKLASERHRLVEATPPRLEGSSEAALVAG